MRILVTGAAGFIGAAMCERLLKEGAEVAGVDNVNDYYDPRLKEARLERLSAHSGFRFFRQDIVDEAQMAALFGELRPQRVLHLAAQAGVRYSVTHPHSYVQSNLVGFLNILEGCRHAGVEHLVYASTSSVYGLSRKMPFSVRDGADHPVSLYGATKRANELMAHAYSHLYGLPATGLRFFTVYGPWGRPDMSLFTFTKQILEGKPIDVYNEGRHQRDFTYIDDIVEGVVRVLRVPPAARPDLDAGGLHPGTSTAPHRVYNIGNSRPVELLRYIEILEDCLGRKAEKRYLPLQPGDVPATWADVSDLREEFEYAPSTPVEEGVRRFVTWYRDYYHV